MGDNNNKTSTEKRRGRPSSKTTCDNTNTFSNPQKKPVYTPKGRGLSHSPRVIIKARDMDNPNGEKCRTCSADTGSDWVRCDMCDYWYHGIKCEGLLQNQYKSYADQKLDIKYLCTFCSLSKTQACAQNKSKIEEESQMAKDIHTLLQTCTGIQNDVTGICGRLDNIETNINTLRTSIDVIDSRVSIVENKFTFNTQDEFKSEVKDNFNNFAMDFKAENFERNLRQKKILISNIPDGTTDDKLFVVQLAAALGLDVKTSDIKTTYRLKRLKAPHNEMLNAEFYEDSIKQRFLEKDAREKLSNLDSSNTYHKYSIWQDRTKMERDDHKALSAEAEKKNTDLIRRGVTDQMYIVRSYRLAPIKKKNPDE